MTVHASFPSQTQRSVAVARPAGIVALSAARSAVFFDAEPGTLAVRQRLSAALDDCPIAGPIAGTRLSLTGDRERHVLLVSQPAEVLCRRNLTLSGGGVVLAAVNPLALQSPMADSAALLAGLDRAGSLRLFKLLLTTGASLFGQGEIGDFGALVYQLVQRLGEHAALVARSPVGKRAWALSWRLPPDLPLPPLAAVTLLANGRTQRVTEVTACEETAGGHRLLHLLIDRPLPKDAEFLALGGTLLCLGMTADVAARPLAGWLANRSAAVRADTLAFVARLSQARPEVAILRDELSCPRDAEPAATPLHLSRSPAGLLYMIGVDDPRGLLAAVRLRTQGGHVDIPCRRLEWHSRHGAVLAGIAAGSFGCDGGVAVAPLYRSGRLGPATAAAVSGAGDLLPDAFRGLPPEVAAVPLAQALPAAMGARPIWRHRCTAFGPVPAAPGVAVVIAAGSAPEYLHAAVASVIREAGGRTVEIVIHHRDGPATPMVRQVAEVLSAVHRVGLCVVSSATQALPSECLRAALGSVRAPRVLALGPGVLPGRRGWLSTWRRRFAATSAPHAIAGEALHPGGGMPGYILGLDAATISRLLSGSPVLPGVLADLRATPGLTVTAANGDGFATFEDCETDELARAVDAAVTSRTAQAPHV